MARDIDFEQPLDADDIEYLRARSWLVDEATLQGFDVRDQVENGVADTEEEEEETPGEDDEVAYSDAKVADLRAELASRELATEGTKAELVARLEADDLAAEDEEEEPV